MPQKRNLLKSSPLKSLKWVSAATLSALLPSAAWAADPSATLSKAMSYQPRQPGVAYEKVAADQLEKCTIEEKSIGDAKGFWITGEGGQPLRWFADTNADNKLDRWCYFKDGVEVYRESDTNFNATADEYRWLSTEGLRWGVDTDENGTIDHWKMISAEEVTAEVVRATRERDEQQFVRLLISPNEIRALGLGKEKQELLEQRVTDAASQFKPWAAGQNVIGPASQWTNFGADKPGIVPAGTNGSSQDLVVYENVVALLEDAGKAKQLLVGTMIQVGNTWRIIDLPKTVSEGAIVSDAGMFFSAAFAPRGAGNSLPEMEGGISKAMERLVQELQDVDVKLSQEGGDMALLQARRADVLEKLVSAAENNEERGTWIRQFAETVSAATQTGEYPGGVDRLQDFATKIAAIKASKDEIAFVVFRTLTADYNLKMMDPKAKYEELQKEYLKNLDGFVRTYPTSEDSAEAMIQIALSSEFSGESKTATLWYEKASKSFGSTLAGRKAEGALKRLQLEGKPFSINQATTLDGRSFSSSSYQGSPVVYHCWASWCDGCKAEMRALRELQAKYAKSKLQIVGLNFDNKPEQGLQFLQEKENQFRWIHLYDKGGLDSDLAVSYGILTLPVNVVVDKTGKVVKTGVHWTELDSVIEDLVK